MSGRSLVRLDLRADPDADLSRVVEHLKGGGVVAYPTETVYGLGGACTPTAVAAVRAAKRRGSDKPLIALVPSVESVSELEWSEEARTLAGIFWPGPLTLVLRDPKGIFPAGVRDAVAGTVGIRVSPHPVAARLVAALAAPLTSTSLNEPGAPPALSGGEAESVLERLEARGVWLLDGGALPPSSPSTVVDCSSSAPVVLRAGTVPIGRIRCALPEIHERLDP